MMVTIQRQSSNCVTVMDIPLKHNRVYLELRDLVAYSCADIPITRLTE